MKIYIWTVVVYSYLQYEFQTLYIISFRRSVYEFRNYTRIIKEHVIRYVTDFLFNTYFFIQHVFIHYSVTNECGVHHVFL
jgi:hypothetical protein